jgi:glycosyltransferase involved in cell wall biosynthesis
MSPVALMIPTIDRIGGAERQVLALATGLRRRGWNVTVVALAGTGGEAAKTLERDGIGYLSLEMRKGLADPRGWLRLLAWLRKHKPDIVHAHLPHAAWMARAARLLVHSPAFVDTIHSASTGCWTRRFGYRLTRSLPGCVVAVSHAAAESHVDAGMVNPQRLKVIYNGVDMEAWRPDAPNRETLRHNLGLGNEFVWLAAGRIEPVKDYPTILRAVAMLSMPARLVIAGAGSQQQELELLAERLGVAGQVRFLGFVPDVRRWMQAADGFILTSRWEGLPIAVLEAAACELPQVATRVSGTCEAIEDGATGLLAEPGDHAGLAKAMNRLMAMPREERRSMGARARQRVIERFSLEAALDRHEELYCELLAAKARKAAGPGDAAADEARIRQILTQPLHQEQARRREFSERFVD